MKFDERVVLIPLMPDECFSALQRGLDVSPFGVTGVVLLGNFVQRGEPVANYFGGLDSSRVYASVVAPFAGKIVSLPKGRGSIEMDWSERMNSRASRSTLFAIQPVEASSIEGCVRESYVPVGGLLRRLCAPRKQGLLSRFLDGKISEHEAASNRRALEALAVLEGSRPRVAPTGVDYDDYFL